MGCGAFGPLDDTVLDYKRQLRVTFLKGGYEKEELGQLCTKVAWMDALLTVAIGIAGCSSQHVLGMSLT